MANNTRTTRSPRVIGALVLTGVLIGGAYIISGPSIPFFTPQTANAADTQQLLKEYAQKDSDNDGLPDWQEALYGTDPKNAHSVSQTLTDGEAVAQGLIKPKFQSQTTASASSTNDVVDASNLPGPSAAPGSLTEQFAQSLFTQYINQSNGTAPSESQINSFVQQSIQSSASTHASQNAYNLANVHVTGSGADALEMYAANVDDVFAAHSANTADNELDYFADAVEKNDSNALTQVAAIGSAYTALAPALMQVSVPSEAAAAHLEITNAAAHLGVDITDMSKMNTDPLLAYLGLYQYQTDAAQLAKGLSDLSSVFTADGVNIESGAGTSIYAAAARAASLKNAQ